MVRQLKGLVSSLRKIQRLFERASEFTVDRGNEAASPLTSILIRPNGKRRRAGSSIFKGSTKKHHHSRLSFVSCQLSQPVGAVPKPVPDRSDSRARQAARADRQKLFTACVGDAEAVRTLVHHPDPAVAKHYVLPESSHDVL